MSSPEPVDDLRHCDAGVAVDIAGVGEDGVGHPSRLAIGPVASAASLGRGRRVVGFIGADVGDLDVLDEKAVGRPAGPASRGEHDDERRRRPGCCVADGDGVSGSSSMLHAYGPDLGDPSPLCL